MTSMPPPEKIRQGKDRYVNFGEECLDLKLADLQKDVLRTVAENQRTIVWGGNGPGKSFVVMVLKLAFLYSNPNAIVLGTSGSYQQYYDTMWRPLEKYATKLQKKYGLPGKCIGGEKDARLEIDDKWYAKTVSPRSPGELEGRHGPDVLVVIDEADKKFVNEEHFSSAESSITDLNDKIVAICNPPEDQADITYRKKKSNRWNSVEFSSFEAHNVLIDAGIIDDQRIQGIVDLITVASDWEAWNREPWPKAPKTYEDDRGESWPGMAMMETMMEDGQVTREEIANWLKPGYEEAKFAHEDRDGLDQKWYIRRAGVIPPDSALTFRPFTAEVIENAYERKVIPSDSPDGVGIDIARKGGDYTGAICKYGDKLEQEAYWKGADHRTNRKRLMPNVRSKWRKAAIAVDAVGSGDSIADDIKSEHPNSVRFNSGKAAAQDDMYYDMWCEGLFMLGEFLESGGSFDNSRLYEELLAASRTVEIEEKYYASREDTVFKATSKDAVAERLGRSPDLLDAALMACWVASDARESGRTEQQLVW